MSAAQAELEEQAAPPSRLRRGLTALVAVLVVGFLVVTVATQWHDLKDADVRFSPGWFGAAFVLLLGFQAIQAEVAGLVLRALGQSVPARRMRAIYSAGLLARYVPSGALTFVVRIGLQEREGTPRRVIVVGVLYELSLAMAGAALLATLVLTRQSTGAAAGAAAGVAVLIAIGLHPRVFGGIADWALRRAGRETLPRTMALPAAAALVGVCALSFVLYGLSLLCLCAGITDLDGGDWPTIIASAAAGFVTGTLGFALPGGLGAREAGLTGVLALVLPGPLALAVAVVSRLLQTLVELLYAGAVNLDDRRRRRVSEPVGAA